MYTFAFLKPDAVKRRLIGPVLEFLDLEDIAPVRMALIRPTIDQVVDHYIEHAKQPYFDAIVKFTLSGTIVAMVLQGDPEAMAEGRVVGELRKAIGPYKNPPKGTIRKEYMLSGCKDYENVIHGADSPDAAEREARIWFPDSGLTGV